MLNDEYKGSTKSCDTKTFAEQTSVYDTVCNKPHYIVFFQQRFSQVVRVKKFTWKRINHHNEIVKCSEFIHFSYSNISV